MIFQTVLTNGGRVSIQSTIETNLASMSPSLARVATAIQERPRLAIEMTINELADATDTSVASVVRFCRAIGLSGYPALRMALASELGAEAAQFVGAAEFGTDIKASDSLQDVAAKLATLDVLAIQETLGNLDFDALAGAVAAIDGAQRVLMYGVGASQFVAEDLAHKLLRIGRNVQVFSDPHEAVAVASLAVPGAVAIGFSHTGTTLETVHFLEVAHASGAPTIAITSNAESKLGRLADHALITAVRESSFRAGAMVSRLAQLAVVDCLFVGVAQQRFDEALVALERTRAATKRLRTPETAKKPSA